MNDDVEMAAYRMLAKIARPSEHNWGSK